MSSTIIFVIMAAGFSALLICQTMDYIDQFDPKLINMFIFEEILPIIRELAIIIIIASASALMLSDVYNSI